MRTIPTVTPTSRLHRYRCWVAWLIGTSMVVVVALAVLVVPAARTYFRIDLFPAYRAGYASVVRVPIHDGDNSGPCDAALLAAYPGSSASADGWTDQELAFWNGCSDRLFGDPADPWNLRSDLAPDTD